MIAADSPAGLPAGFWRWPHIDPAREWADRISGAIAVVPEFLDKLEALRARVGRPLVIVSGYRTPEHNAAISRSGESGPHTHARAVDIRIYGTAALELVRHAMDLGFTGFGFEQSLELAPIRRYVHLDDLTAADGFPARPNLWSY